MKSIKRDLPIYVLSAALVFLGVSISTQTAGAASTNDPRVSTLKTQFESFKYCANRNFRELSNLSQNSSSSYLYIRTCY
jgi:hypothetical protein